jgi:hypothetical protein
MSKRLKMEHMPSQERFLLTDLDFEMFAKMFETITFWAPLQCVSKLLRAHVKRCIDTPTGSTLKAHYKMNANRFNQASMLQKSGAFAEIQLYCQLYQLTSLTVSNVVRAEQFYTFGELLAQNAVHLTSLNLSGTRLPVRYLEPLTRLSRLAALDLSRNQCLAHSQHLLALPANLRSLTLDSCRLRGMGYAWATQVTGLNLLSLQGNLYQGQDGGYVSSHIHWFPQLHTLCLRNASLQLEPLAAILANVSTTLTSLDVAYNLVGASTTPVERAPMYTALARLTALTELNLAGCFLAQTDELSTAVSVMSALTLLDISASGLSDPLSADAAADHAALVLRGVSVVS